MSESMTISQSLEGAVKHIQGLAGGMVPKLGVVLGSGLGGLVDAMDGRIEIPYQEIPGFAQSTVAGHAGKLVLGTLGGVPMAAMQGRVHLYEGYDLAEVVFPIRVLIKLGVEGVVVTNAAGSVNPAFDEREIMLITDHLNLSTMNPLVGKNDPDVGLRFPDMSTAYDLEYLQVARRVAKDMGLKVQEGVYAGLLGPSYETPAEVRMLHILGGDAVGMSTVNEVIAARHMGARVLGISCISNKGAGLSSTPLNHEEVKEAGQALQGKVIDLVRGVAVALYKD